MNEHSKRWMGFILLTGCASAAGGVLVGFLSKGFGWGLSGQVIFIGLTVGLAISVFHWPVLNERIVVGTIASAIGLGLFAWSSQHSEWQAETDIANHEIDDLSVRVMALRLCHDRKIMGVFDFNDVPKPIREEARQMVDRMSHSEKLSMLNRTFGGRINNCASAKSIGAGSMSFGGLWITLALAGSAIPAVIRHRFNNQ